MAAWPDSTFLLEGKTAERLYTEYAADLPIIDFHSHLSPALLVADHRFENLTRIWLEGDHYKWRAMRACGIDEHRITGEAPDEEKFHAWACTVPRLLGSPLYQWTHMELAHPFGITDLRLNEKSAASIWETCNPQLASADCTARALLARAGVSVLCTTDDPCDDLRDHTALADDLSFSTGVYPTFRADPVLNLEPVEPWNRWVDRLGHAAGRPINDWRTMLDALGRRIAYFHARVCRAADHGLEGPPGTFCGPDEADALFALARSGRPLSPDQVEPLQGALLHELGLLYHAHGWTQQFHIGALRNINTRLLRRVGRDAGGDTIGDAPLARPLARMLDRWDQSGQLARTILYNVNPRDNELLVTLAGSFHDGSVPGTVQVGPAWWFNDHRDGIERHLRSLANVGVLGVFVGMVTDSRSFLSFSRHDYFRRVLCTFLGRQMDRGDLPRDLESLGGMVRAICHDNASAYFRFPSGTAAP